jgi:DNA (cytosine-5)-methyltransferase 1
MEHYGDISALNGAEICPVDIITFGSPCQDMSVAGKRNGLDGSRSSLFYEAIRIIREMREATNGKYPRYIVWENVPGAFSSNKGEDFRAVLEEVCKVKDEQMSIPKPAKWETAGRIMGDGYSVAWRQLDAQFWGVPQRRKRIYLVADFDGGCAGKILFESEGLSGYSAESFRAWQRAAGNVAESTPETGTVCLNDQGGNRMDVTEDKTCTLRAESHHPPLVFENHSQDSRYTGPLDVAQTVLSTFGTGGNNQPFVLQTPKTLKIRSGCEGGGKGALIQDDLSATLACNNDQTLFQPTAYGICAKHSNSMLSDNPNSGFYEAKTSRCLDGNGGNPTCNQGGIAVIEGNGSRPSHKGDGYKESDVMYTLNATEQHAVAFCSSKASFFTLAEEELANTLVATDYKDPPIVNDVHTASGKEVFGTLAADMGEKQWLGNHEAFSGDYHVREPDYIVRRLTPTECARLQGFPDWWCDDLGIEEPTEEDIDKWREIFITHAKALGKTTKPKPDNQIRKWLKNPHSDSAEYKMWGNGVALPNVVFVLSGIVYYSQFCEE